MATILAFDPIVAVDLNSAIPHYNTKEGQGVVKNYSIILIDFGVKYKNYCSDITRMVFFGRPKDEDVNIYRKLLTIQEKTIASITNSKRSHQNSILGKDIDSCCRKLISDNQLPNFPHSLGHGVGLEIHEYPKISQLSEDHIINNQVFTVEPGVYFDGKWGMRIEDTVVVENNKVESLTKFTKKAIVLNF